jgi:hypothetical protein
MLNSVAGYDRSFTRNFSNEEAIAIHQMGMVERMAKNYEKALHHFDEELRLLSDHGLDNYLKLSANFYERAIFFTKL